MSALSKGAGRIAALLTITVMASGCAHVSEDDFQTEMDRVRAEMLEADQALEARIADNESAIQDLESRLDQVQADLEDLATEFDATVDRFETALRFAAPVHFDFDDATVRTEDREVLRRFASVVNEHYPGALVTVEGFTDPSGSAAYNLRLGQRRADAVKAVLVDEGSMNGDFVRTVSYGEDTSRLVRPGAQGPGQEGLSNRRVVMVIDHQDDAATRAIVTEAAARMGSAGGR